MVESQYLLAENEQFKVNKLNLIWSKAQHSLGPGKLKDLKNDLSRHESEELSLKKMKAHNQDKDGLFEAAVRKKLHIILSRYNLERYYDDIHPSPIGSVSSEKFESPVNEPDSDSRNFRDSRLDKLWKKAEKAGFTQEQLMVLHEEFQHQQDKLDDHYDTMNMVEEEVKAMLDSEKNFVNSIDNSDAGDRRKGGNTKESQADKKARLEENIHQTLKERYKDIKKGINHLKEKIVIEKVDTADGPFELKAVSDLWTSALDSNFTDAELESLKEELGHYENRIKKLQHFQNELERTQISSKLDYSETDKETRHIEKKVQELTRKVEKAQKSIRKMLSSKREEL